LLTLRVALGAEVHRADHERVAFAEVCDRGRAPAATAPPDGRQREQGWPAANANERWILPPDRRRGSPCKRVKRVVSRRGRVKILATLASEAPIDTLAILTRLDSH
jgi:hypothetical protein